MEILNANGVPMLAGFYWDGKKIPVKINHVEGDDTNGVFLYNLNSKKLIGKHDWNEDLNNKFDYKSLKVTDVLVNNDDIIIFGERQLYKSEFRKSNGTPTTEMDYFYTFGATLMVNMDTKGTLKKMYSLYEASEFKNEVKEKAGYALLNLKDGLFLFSNRNGNMIMDHFFTNEDPSFSPPKVRLNTNTTSSVPYIIPHTFRTVDGYGLAYYLSSYGDTYWVTKMTW